MARTGVAQLSRTQTVNGFEFPTGPGGRQRFRTEGDKWRAINVALAYVSDCLGPADRGFYRQLIGLHSMAMCNLRDRQEAAGSVEELPLPWEGPPTSVSGATRSERSELGF